MRRPSMGDMPSKLATAARTVASLLAAEGERAWLVGGAVRDMALELEPNDVDLATAAHPDRIEALFPASYAVGRAFGTIVVHVSALDVQVTTFRRESGYADARRPDQVSFGASLEEDARRRDFTMNALYLDPLTDELRDPEGGLLDLERGVLRAVGDPALRFREDGLRILRLARFAARFGLSIEPRTEAAARASLSALAGVSCERVMAELEAIGLGPESARAAELLLASGALQAALPGSKELFAQGALGLGERLLALRNLERRLALGALEGAGDFALFLAALFDPRADGTTEQGGPKASAAEAFVDTLRASRCVLDDVKGIWRSEARIAALLAAEAQGRVSRAARIRLVRGTRFARAMALHRAFAGAALAWNDLEGFAAALTPAELHPAPLLSSADLVRAGVKPGARFGALLRRAEELQLDLEHGTRDAALAWLAREVG